MMIHAHLLSEVLGVLIAGEESITATVHFRVLRHVIDGTLRIQELERIHAIQVDMLLDFRAKG